jgi:hypothetical protein
VTVVAGPALEAASAGAARAGAARAGAGAAAKAPKKAPATKKAPAPAPEAPSDPTVSTPAGPEAEPQDERTEPASQPAPGTRLTSPAARGAGGGVMLALMLHPVLLAYLRGGTPRVKQWLRAKFLNQVDGTAGGSSSSGGSHSKAHGTPWRPASPGKAGGAVKAGTDLGASLGTAPINRGD